jgi:hypothetical protein
MYRKLGKFLALLFAFFLGVGLTAYWYSRVRTAHKDVPAEISFLSGQHSRVMAASGLYEDLSIYESSDGVTVTVMEDDFSNEAQRQRELAALLDASRAEVIERKPIMNEAGDKQVGERIVGRTSILDSEPHAFIFTTHGDCYRRIEGRSLNHLLEVEKALK